MVGSGKRIACALLFAALALIGVVAAPALAVEEGDPAQHEAPTIEEVGTQSETAREFFPEAYEAPPVFDYFLWILGGAALLVTIAVLLLYLVWQPRFAEERRTKRRR